jgi:large subunit ribosomal protein L6
MINNFYIFKPIYVDFLELSENYLVLAGPETKIFIPKFFVNRSLLTSAKNLLQRIKKNLKTSFQILYTKGIGFKVYYYSKDHSLYINLGYNHLCQYRLSYFLITKVRKQYMLLYSSPSQISIISPISEICGLRTPDPYLGKGIRVPFKDIKLKPGKQR